MGGGSLKWGPPLVKRDLDYRFLPRIVNPLKWVCGSEWVGVFVKNEVKWVGVFVKNEVKWVCTSGERAILSKMTCQFLASCHF